MPTSEKTLEEVLNLAAKQFNVPRAELTRIFRDDVHSVLLGTTSFWTGVDVAGEALTPREVEVLRLLAQGLPSKAIASQLRISEHTVKFHVGSIMGKLGAASRTEAVTLAIRRGLIAL